MAAIAPAHPATTARLAGVGLAASLSLLLLLALVRAPGLQDFLVGLVSGLAPGSAEHSAYRGVQDYLWGTETALLEDLRFSYRERVHLRDVRDRLQQVGAYGGVAAALTVTALLAGLAGRRNPIRLELAVLATTAGLALLTLAGALLLCMLIFDYGFALLHWPLFENRNWILPADALTLRIYPPAYFLALLVCQSLTMAAVAGALLVLGRRLGGSGQAGRSSAGRIALRRG